MSRRRATLPACALAAAAARDDVGAAGDGGEHTHPAQGRAPERVAVTRRRAPHANRSISHLRDAQHRAQVPRDVP